MCFLVRAASGRELDSELPVHALAQQIDVPGNGLRLIENILVLHGLDDIKGVLALEVLVSVEPAASLEIPTMDPYVMLADP